MTRPKRKINPWVTQRKTYSEEGILEAVKEGLRTYPLWLATEYPVSVVVSHRHGLKSIILHMSTGRTFDIKIKERRSRTSGS